MAEGDQKLNTILIPESGLNLAPEFVAESLVSPNFLRVFAHLIAKSPDRGILVKATSDGSLRVAFAGVPFEVYVIYNGTGADTYAAPNIIELAYASNVTDLLIETFPSTISFRNVNGVWLPDKAIPVGCHSIDFIHYGFRIRNRNAGDNTVYELTLYH